MENFEEIFEELIELGFFVPRKGKDFGWSSKLHLENPDPKNPSIVYLSQETISFLIKKGAGFYSGFGEKEKCFGFYDSNKWGSTYGSYGPGNFFMSLSLSKVTFSDKILYNLVGISGDYGFGSSFVKQVGKKAKKHCQDQFLHKLESFIKSAY